jgi:hypothetical protein
VSPIQNTWTEIACLGLTRSGVAAITVKQELSCSLPSVSCGDLNSDQTGKLPSLTNINSQPFSVRVLHHFVQFSSAVTRDIQRLRVLKDSMLKHPSCEACPPVPISVYDSLNPRQRPRFQIGIYLQQCTVGCPISSRTQLPLSITIRRKSN